MVRAVLILATVMVSAVMVEAWAGSIDRGELGWTAMPAMLGEEEMEMDSEINRRILQTNNYISYGALSRGNTPCSRAGASYYNCRPGGQQNPYTRGCSAITRCSRS